MDRATALPAWLSEILPNWLVLGKPAFTEAAYAFIVALLMGCATALFTIFTAYAAIVPTNDQSFFGFVGVVGKCWFAVVAPMFFAWVRGRTASLKATAAAEKSP